MAKKKQHEKKKFETGVYAPDGTFYQSGNSAEVRLVRIMGRKGIWWSHSKKDLTWRKVSGDEIVREV